MTKIESIVEFVINIINSHNIELTAYDNLESLGFIIRNNITNNNNHIGDISFNENKVGTLTKSYNIRISNNKYLYGDHRALFVFISDDKIDDILLMIRYEKIKAIINK